MAEWTNAPVLKTGVPKGTGGSNPSPSVFLVMYYVYVLYSPTHDKLYVGSSATPGPRFILREYWPWGNGLPECLGSATKG